jgi:hypothetical protein
MTVTEQKLRLAAGAFRAGQNPTDDSHVRWRFAFLSMLPRRGVACLVERQEHGTCGQCGSPVLLADAAGGKMDALSPVAMVMLQGGRWHQTERNPTAIASRIEQAERPRFQPAIAFQALFGGLEYVARDGHGFHFDLFHLGPGIEHLQASISQEEDGFWYYGMGWSRTAQIGYFLRQDGVVCAAGDEVMVPIAASVEKYIEGDAVLDEMLGVQMCWWQVSLGAIARDDRRLDAIVAVGHSVIERASDDYTTWWEDDNSRIRRGVALDTGPNWHLVHAYFRTREAASSFVDVVRDVIAGPFDIYRFALKLSVLALAGSYGRAGNGRATMSPGGFGPLALLGAPGGECAPIGSRAMLMAVAVVEIQVALARGASPARLGVPTRRWVVSSGCQSYCARERP